MKILYCGFDFATYSDVSHECRVARHLAEQGHDVELVVNRNPGWDRPIPAQLHQQVQPLDHWLARQQYGHAATFPDADVAFASSASGAPFLVEWKKRTGRPVVAQVLDLPLWRLVHGPKAPWFDQWKPWFDALMRMDDIVVNTRQTAHDLLAAAKLYGHDPDRIPRITVVYYGIDTATADVAPPVSLEGVRKGAKVAVGCSRLVPYKGYEHAISALSLIPAETRPEYAIIGEGEDMARIVQFGQHCDVRPLFAGGVNDQLKFGIVKASDFGLALAFNRNIPFQFPLEAVYCERPCVVADTPINRERFLDHGVVYVNPFDTHAVADAVRDLVIDGSAHRPTPADLTWIMENRSFASHAREILVVLRHSAG